MSLMRRRLVLAASLVILVLLGWLAYGFSLRLPFFADDMVHFRWLAWHDFGGIWSSARLLGYYRPVVFTVWKVLWLLQGGHDPLTLHALNVGLHLLNGVLVLGLLAGRGKGSHLLGFATAILFLLFPFSYQAVPWVGALTHPLVTALILGALRLHRESRAHRSKTLLAASIALASLAPFAHETGVLIAPALLLLLLTEEEPLRLRDALRQIIPYCLCAALGIAVWSVVPKEVKQVNPLNPENWWQNGVYFAQGLAYPLSPLARRLLAAVKVLTDLQAIALIVGPALLAWAFFLWKAGRGKLVALALGWFVLFMGPSWLLRGFDYVIDGPRLFYEASVGAALLWAIPISIAWHGRWRALLGRSFAVLLVVGAGLGGYRFVRARVPLYEQMRDTVEQLVALTRSAPPSEALLCVNFPAWFAPRAPTFAVGHEGVTLVPDYSSLTDLLWLHTGEERPLASVVLPDLLQPWRYHYACVGAAQTGESIQAELRKAKQVVVVSYEGDLALHEAGGLEAERGAPMGAFLASFDGHIGLASALWELEDTSLRVVLRWQCWDQLAADTTVFLHLYNAAGRLVAQADGYPLRGTSRPALWQPGDQWRDVRVLSLSKELAPGEYALRVGLYPVAGGPRLIATGPGGQRFQDEALPIGTLRVADTSAK
jgi:hypothetical protein